MEILVSLWLILKIRIWFWNQLKDIYIYDLGLVYFGGIGQKETLPV